ncbi:DUF1425 domain-containing protein [Shimwellia pseudoproteus]|uniref:YcfL family protein n=1 Tax=Shimwellia pseudoproteus TaxID=570012 RepID=UPI0018EE2161|nr:YcfL family protein [Shimwellia pseudoproteus]MBJ3815478.1 DUF1425 domain-containing protein [Shimwellia pseudoproteus]
MRTGLIAVLLSVLGIAGCQSRPEIPVNKQQTLVMETSVLAAGITASNPEVTTSGVQHVATSELYNETNQPITINYRFYWYDNSGLEMHPLAKATSVVVAAHASATITALTDAAGASKVRLYLYL